MRPCCLEVFRIVFSERGTRALGVPVRKIGIRVFIGTVDRQRKALLQSLPGQKIHTLDHRCSNIIDMHGTTPEPLCPFDVVVINRTIPIGNETTRTQRDDVHVMEIPKILDNLFGQQLAAPVQRVRPANAGCRDVDNFIEQLKIAETAEKMAEGQK